MSSRKSIRVDDYEKGLLIAVITQVISDANSFSDDDIDKLKDIKKRMQARNGAK